jgi:hypothetical protein
MHDERYHQHILQDSIYDVHRAGTVPSLSPASTVDYVALSKQLIVLWRITQPSSSIIVFIFTLYTPCTVALYLESVISTVDIIHTVLYLGRRQKTGDRHSSDHFGSTVTLRPAAT